MSTLQGSTVPVPACTRNCLDHYFSWHRLSNCRNLAGTGQFQYADNNDPYQDQQKHCLHVHSPSAWSLCPAFFLPPYKNLCLHWDAKMGFEQEAPVFSRCLYLNKPLSFFYQHCLKRLVLVQQVKLNLGSGSSMVEAAPRSGESEDR